ncbi:MAG: hypothetical protein M1453_02235 [Acidobacteria bacterium]|nr:hypothetical protein [Acidobacteriota bacterium]MCL5286803.1 hypothetical protein [Acidobacteriota bacterium]
MTTSETSAGRDELKRVEYLTLGLGLAACPIVVARWGWFAAAGFLTGVLVSWINFRWLKQGVRVLAQSATAQAGEENIRVPKRARVRLVARFALLLAVLCAILFGSWLPGGAVLAGLFAAVAAVLVEMVYRLCRALLQSFG